MEGVLNILGRDILPSVFGSLNAAGVVDTMDVIAESASTDHGGEMVKAGGSVIYPDVPVSYEVINQGLRGSKAESQVSIQAYLLTFPTHCNGVRMIIDPATHRLKINARGNEPEKLFRIKHLGDVSGVNFEARCEREN